MTNDEWDKWDDWELQEEKKRAKGLANFFGSPHSVIKNVTGGFKIVPGKRKGQHKIYTAKPSLTSKIKRLFNKNS